MSDYWLSVIIPTLNEEKFIGSRLENLGEVFPRKDVEVIVADGGSGDGTREAVRRYPGVKIVSSAPGRGPQLNRGAAEARGDVLLFLHADACLPAGAGELIRRASREKGTAGGCFQIKTIPPPGKGRLFRLLLKTADWRSRFSRFPYGDQAVFVKRTVFERMGGFRNYPIMEDLDFSKRLRRVGKIVRIKEPVQVSGRRWDKNIVVNFIKLKTFPLLFRLGVSPRFLARFYR